MLYVMLVGAYPFERPEDKHDNQKLQKMIQVRVDRSPG
jgi:serine/threonine-protein kinase SRK2